MTPKEMAEIIVEEFWEEHSFRVGNPCIVRITPNRWSIGVISSNSGGLGFAHYGAHDSIVVHTRKFDYRTMAEVRGLLFPPKEDQLKTIQE